MFHDFSSSIISNLQTEINQMHITLAKPRGFCAGVVRAIDIVEQALQLHGAPVYVFHEIVHNRYVVENLKERGAIFVENIEEIPQKAICIFSAHGVAAQIVEQAAQRDLRAIDATCPLVTKVHAQARRYAEQGCEIVIVGHLGHPEVEGTRGQVKAIVHVLCSVEEVLALCVQNPAKLAYVTQTTLSLDDTREIISALENRFPLIQGPNLQDICYATQNRQHAIKTLAHEVDILLVVGAKNSSNSNRLKELGVQMGIPSYLIADAQDLEQQWFEQKPKVGITAGASAPEILVQGVIEKLQSWGISHVEEMNGVEENVNFRVPVNALLQRNSFQTSVEKS
ncbi:MAG: 4-hydroxy-3-methylbut-2-enyl diphosphate reductase [Pseudomonadota bacterium]|jgi:4-hydroxy-3-methylbut-2-enyl diphosphate reductase